MKRREKMAKETMFDMYLSGDWFCVSDNGVVVVNRPKWNARLYQYRGDISHVPSPNHVSWEYPLVKHMEKHICRELVIVSCRLAELETDGYVEYVWRVNSETDAFDVCIDLLTHTVTIKRT